MKLYKINFKISYFLFLYRRAHISLILPCNNNAFTTCIYNMYMKSKILHWQFFLHFCFIEKGKKEEELLVLVANCNVIHHIFVLY